MTVTCGRWGGGWCGERPDLPVLPAWAINVLAAQRLQRNLKGNAWQYNHTW